MHWAAAFNSVDVARLLIENGAEVDVKDGNGGTLLQLAAKRNSTEVARLLIEHGASTEGIDLSWMDHQEDGS